MFGSCHGYREKHMVCNKKISQPAMCAVDQLQFSAVSGGSLDSLAACFPPLPSPMELHGAVQDGHCSSQDSARASHSAVQGLGERLALAVRLARRDLRLSLAHGPVPVSSVHIPAQRLPQVVHGAMALSNARDCTHVLAVRDSLSLTVLQSASTEHLTSYWPEYH